MTVLHFPVRGGETREQMLELLAELTRQVEADEVEGLALAFVRDDASIGLMHAGKKWSSLVGAVAALQYDLLAGDVESRTK